MMFNRVAWMAVWTCSIVATIPANPAFAAYTFSSLYPFQGGSDGQAPDSAVVFDSAGNVYGTTEDGGHSGTGCLFGFGCGTVYKLTPDGTEAPLYSFNGGDDGEIPVGGLIIDGAGNLYGTTISGGVHGAGTAFQIAPDGSETVLHVFGDQGDGQIPYAGLAADAHGRMYGTTIGGGAFGYGTIFKVTTGGKETVSYSFTGGSDGAEPYNSLILGKNGTFYGTSVSGGDWNEGTVFAFEPPGGESVLYSFHGALKHGSQPYAKLVRDRDGNLYGTTYAGGEHNLGAVFKVTPDGAETVLYSFKGGAADGAYPTRSLVLDGKNNLLGTTTWGGKSGCSSRGCGTVFKVTQAGKETIIHLFKGDDGSEPAAGLTLDSGGNLYGTTDSGGLHGLGTVFKLSRQ